MFKWKAKKSCMSCGGKGYFDNPFDQTYRCDCYKTTKAFKARNAVYCVCGADVSTMKGCVKKGPQWYCVKCKETVTRLKLEQLMGRIMSS